MQHLDRRDNEKVWNALNEIKTLFHYSSSKPLHINLLAGWARKAHEEGTNGLALIQMLEIRILAFEYIEDSGAITIKKKPKKTNLKGEFIILVDKKNFDKFYKTAGKTYKAKATAYQQRILDEKEPSKKINPNDFGVYVEEGKIGYLKIGKKKIRIAGKNTRRCKLLKYLWDPNYVGSILTIESVFDGVRMLKDAGNPSLGNLNTKDSEKKKILRNTFKEIARILKQHNVRIFKFGINNKSCSLKLKAKK